MFWFANGADFRAVPDLLCGLNKTRSWSCRGCRGCWALSLSKSGESWGPTKTVCKSAEVFSEENAKDLWIDLSSYWQIPNVNKKGHYNLKDVLRPFKLEGIAFHCCQSQIQAFWTLLPETSCKQAASLVRQQNSAYLVCPIGRLFETCLNFKLYSDSILSFKPLQCWAKSERSAVRGLCSRWEFLMKASCPPIWTQRWPYWLYLYLIYFISILPLKTAQKPDHHVQSARHLNKNLGTSLYSER